MSVTTAVADQDPQPAAGTTSPYTPPQNSAHSASQATTAPSPPAAAATPPPPDPALIDREPHRPRSLQLIRDSIVPNHHHLHRRQQQPLQRQPISPGIQSK